MNCSFFSSLGLAYLANMVLLSVFAARWQVAIIRKRARFSVLKVVFVTVGLISAGLVFFVLIVANPVLQIIGGVNVDDFFEGGGCESSLFFGGQMFCWMLVYSACLLFLGVTEKKNRENQ